MADVFYTPYIVVNSDVTQTLIAGDIKTFYIDTGMDLTYNTVFFDMSAIGSQPPADTWGRVVNRPCTISDPVNGIAFITLTSTETSSTGNYRCQISVGDTSGAPIQTIFMFNLLILSSLIY